MQVKITDPGFAGFTGHFGSVYFENGVSEHISSAEAERLGCIVRCETTEGVNPSATQRMVDIHSKNLEELMAKGQGVVGASREVEQKPEAQDPQVNSSVAKAEDGKPGFVRADLEALADKEGIAGLRNIGSQYGVKGRSIVEIIDELVALSGPAQEAQEAQE